VLDRCVLLFKRNESDFDFSFGGRKFWWKGNWNKINGRRSRNKRDKQKKRMKHSSHRLPTLLIRVNPP